MEIVTVSRDLELTAALAILWQYVNSREFIDYTNESSILDTT